MTSTTISRYQPQKQYADLSSKASNIGFMAADENRRKGKKEFKSQDGKRDLLPAQRTPIRLSEALGQGGETAQQAVSEMLEAAALAK